VGSLWSSSGELLASATFNNETTSGWQQVNFSHPVPITANTAYVASYHSSSGYLSIDNGYFMNLGVDNPPLHAAPDGSGGANGGGGPNGLYVFADVPTFPTNAYNSSNFYVDVVFNYQ
jgi:hypothetical protein